MLIPSIVAGGSTLLCNTNTHSWEAFPRQSLPSVPIVQSLNGRLFACTSGGDCNRESILCIVLHVPTQALQYVCVCVCVCHGKEEVGGEQCMVIWWVAIIQKFAVMHPF